MNLRIPRLGALALVIVVAFGVALFLYLSARFGGPSISFSTPYELRAAIADTQGLAGKSDVLVRGVKVGEVSSIATHGTRANVKFSVRRRYAPVGRDATVRVGQKTLLGETYLDLSPGRRARGTLSSGDAIAPRNVLPSVEIDEALAALDAPARSHVRALLGTFARGARSAQTSGRLSDTLAGVSRLVDELNGLQATLHGQEGDIAGAVQDSRVVLRALGDREAALRTIVGRGRRTLEALGSDEPALRAGVAELPRLLRSAQRTLADARPLIHAARPVVADLRRAAPPLSSALAELPAVARDGRAVLARLESLNRAAIPLLARALPVVELARPVARGLGPALDNVVPMLRYLSPRRNTIAAWFSNTGDLGLNGDSKGSWARFFIFAEPGTASGLDAGTLQNNAYTTPDDAAANRPYRAGDYPRLRPYAP